jgi:hypothetical protein
MSSPSGSAVLLSSAVLSQPLEIHVAECVPKTQMRAGADLRGAYSDDKLRIVTMGFRVGDRSRGRYATPADFSRHGGTPYRGLRVRRWGLGFVHHSRAIFCRAVPNLTLRFATSPSLYSGMGAAAAGDSRLSC